MSWLIVLCLWYVFQNETHYTASVTLFSAMDQYISPGGTAETPRIHLELPISCGYMKNMVISADFSSMGYSSFVFKLSIPCLLFWQSHIIWRRQAKFTNTQKCPSPPYGATWTHHQWRTRGLTLENCVNSAQIESFRQEVNYWKASRIKSNLGKIHKRMQADTYIAPDRIVARSPDKGCELATGVPGITRITTKLVKIVKDKNHSHSYTNLLEIMMGISFSTLPPCVSSEQW